MCMHVHACACKQTKIENQEQNYNFLSSPPLKPLKLILLSHKNVAFTKKRYKSHQLLQNYFVGLTESKKKSFMHIG